jgi:hypothetical protein
MIKMGLKETGMDVVGCIYVVHSREKLRTVVNTVMNRVTS